MTDPDMLKLIFGFKVAYHRQQRSLSYQELANITGLSPAYLHEIEKGKKYPKADKILLLAKAFGVTYDEMVSLHASKKLQPIIDLLESDWLKVFPLEEMFGISASKLLELFANTPDKVNAFISTIIKIARNYQMQTEHFFNAALRSYQDLHDNYFEDLELAVKNFREAYLPTEEFPYATSTLANVLYSEFGISIDRKMLAQNTKLQKIRSVYSPQQKTLFLNHSLSEAQQNFLIGRELAFQYLQLADRPYETIIQKADTFEKLLNNFKASYFSGALLMGENEIVADVVTLAQMPVWDETKLFAMLTRYNVTAEMLLQRLTNLLPHHFEIKDLFFLRIFGNENLQGFRMNKELHLSRLHSPYANYLQEHYCRRWVSINILKRLRANNKQQIIADAQISDYWETDNAYLCISFAKLLNANKESVSVTLGLMVNDKLRSLFRFLNDPQLKKRQVNTTCERCSMPDCSERAVPPVVIERQNDLKAVEQEVARLISGDNKV